ncbi:MAG: serine/threonine protein kinase [Myxococcales bacterium]|nr:serine/threonine protein kinase [Myxococcales bacterium]
MSVTNDDPVYPTDRWARSVCDAAEPQDSDGRRLEDAAFARLFGAKSAVMNDREGRDLENQAHSLLFQSPPPATEPATTAEPVPERYVVHTAERLGRGGSADVYLATDTRLGRHVAFKIFLRAHHDDGERQRVQREAQALARLNDENIVGVYDHGVLADRLFLVMEHVPGGTLRDWQLREPRTWREILRLYLAAGRGLAAIHKAGLVHRDFKPHNVLLDARGRPKLTDFGLTVAPGVRTAPTGTITDVILATQLTDTTKIAGTPFYLAPEQLEGARADARSDQFNYCVALYQALYGGHPYAKPDPALAGREATAGSHGAIGTTPTAPPSWASLHAGLKVGALIRPNKIVVPRGVFKALARGLRVDPDERYPTMDALLADLARDPLRTHGPPIALAGLTAAAVSALFVPQMLGVCKDIAADFRDAWTAADADAVKNSFAATGSPHATAASAHVRETLDDYRARWLVARQDNCDATRDRGAQEPEVGRRRDTCLDEARDTLATVVQNLRHADAATVETIQSSLTDLLPPLEHCDADFQRNQTCLDSADDPALRERLDDARALEIAGKYREAAAAAADLLNATTDRPRLAAEAQLLRGRTLTELNQGPDASAALEAAYRLSETADCDVLTFEAATRTTKLHALVHSLPADSGLSWSTVARSRLGKLPPSSRLVADYHSDLGLLFVQREDLHTPDRLSRARHELDQARELRTRLADGQKTLDLGITYLNLAALALAEDKPNDALVHARRSLENYTAAYRVQDGESHPALWKPHRILGNVYLALDKPSEGRRELERSIELARTSHGEAHAEVGVMQYALAVSYAEEAPQHAIQLADTALSSYKREIPDDDPQRADPLVFLGVQHLHLEDPKRALPYLQEALQRQTRADPATRARTHLDLAIAFEALAQRGRARDHVHMTNALLAEVRSPDPELVEDKEHLEAALKAADNTSNKQ